jgi:catechol 2,3-dioxygenase-like lactoylglutathione lyase family enzyme
MNTMRMNWAVIFVQDVSATVAFYRDLLGLIPIKEGPGSTRLGTGDGTGWLSIHGLTDNEQPPWNDGVMLHFETDELDAVCERLDQAGVTFWQKPRMMPWGWRHAYVYDPGGHVVSLYDPRDGRAQAVIDA